MPLSQEDRIAFSAQIIGAQSTLAGIATAQAQINAQAAKLQALDTANKNLFDPVNVLVNKYQQELGSLDAVGRTTFNETDIVNSANKILQNKFFPNDTTIVVPSLASLFNVWPRIAPFALTFAIGKSYVETYSVVPKEGTIITTIQGLISSLSAYTDMQLTTGLVGNGTCTLPIYTDQVTCVANSGVWTPAGGTHASANILSVLNSIISSVNSLITFLNTELTYIVTTDTTSPNQANNQAAIDYINNVFKPALQTWLALPNFEITGAGPSKLHSTQKNALSLALTNRLTFISTRISQLTTTLGTIVQDISTGSITSSSGYYGSRYGYLSLRLNALGGSLTQLSSSQNASNAQTQVSDNIRNTAATYMTFIPTTGFKSPGNGTAFVHLLNVSFLSVGDPVYVMADSQQELKRAVKTINGNTVTLNDIVPSKYSTNIRLYKDLT